MACRSSTGREPVGVKLVVCARTDLQLGKGKLAAQVGHASVSAALDAQKGAPGLFREWVHNGQPKVVVKVSGIKELEEVERRARDAGLHTRTVTDAGRTQIAPGTVTCLAIGPDNEGKIDTVTGHLKLM